MGCRLEIACDPRTRGATSLVIAGLVSAIVLALLTAPLPPAQAGSTRDVQHVGLPFLYEALFAVANCANVALDRVAFTRAARLYRLVPEDLTISGPFAPDIAALDASYRLRLDDDHAAFCSMSRLSFAVPYGVLVDRGPVVPHPLPIGRPD